MSIFKGTLKPYVIRQLKARQALLSTEGSRPLNVQLYTGGKTAWVKMSSFVDYADKPGEPPTNALARKYMLEGGAMLEDPSNKDNFGLRAGVANANGSYGSNLGNRQLGLRPIPGITSVNVTNKGAYGSLRLTTVKFKAWDKKQLDDLEILYMRTGYPVLIEWGWSMYLDTSTDQDKDFTAVSNSGDININADSISKLITKPIKPFTDPTINPFELKGDQEYLYNELLRLSHKFSGNYDGMVGFIQNFTWELLPNGSYDCTTVLVSMGDTLDSIKMNKPSTRSSESGDVGYKTSFSELMDKLITKRGDKDQAIRSQDSVTKSVVVIWLEKYANVINTEQDKATYPSYLKMSDFIRLIRTNFGLLDRQDKPFINIEIPDYTIKTNRGNGLCIASVDSVSVDPNICLIGNPRASWVTGDVDGFTIKGSNREDILEPFLCPDETYKYSSLGQIGNIYVNIQHLIKVFNDTVNSSKDGEVHMYSFLRQILQDISNAIGNVNDFDVFVEDNKAIIIDKNYTELSSEMDASKKFQLNIFGTDTVVRSFKIVSKIFQSQSNMIAIAAGTSRLNLGGVNTSTQQALNKGLGNRLIKLSTQEQKDIYDSEREAKLDWASNMLDLRAYLQGFLKKKSFPISGDAVAFAKTTLNSVILNVNSDANYRAIIPIQVELTLDGISGITPGEIFRLNTDMIPKEYSNKNIGFIVRNVQHSIVKSDWTTTIEAYMASLNLMDTTNKSGDQNTLSGEDKINLNGLFNEVIRERGAKYAKYVQSYLNLIAFIEAYYKNRLKLIVYNEPVYFDTRDNSIVTTDVNKIPKEFRQQSTSRPSLKGVQAMDRDVALIAAGVVISGESVINKYINSIDSGRDGRTVYILNPILDVENRYSPDIPKFLKELILSHSEYSELTNKQPELASDLMGIMSRIGDSVTDTTFHKKAVQYLDQVSGAINSAPAEWLIRRLINITDTVIPNGDQVFTITPLTMHVDSIGQPTVERGGKQIKITYKGEKAY